MDVDQAGRHDLTARIDRSARRTRAARLDRHDFDPHVVRMPRVGVRSLIDTGMPCSGPSGARRVSAGSHQCLLGGDRAVGVERRVDALDPLQDRAGQLER